MKVFKGCINPSCSAYKKIHYKKNDDYCTKCGAPLQFVCADCWTQLEDDSEKYCILCKNKRKDEADKRIDGAKDAVKKVGGGVAAAAGVAVMAAKNAKQLQGAVKDLAKIGKDILKK
ncbi:MAG: hypothetical protein PHS82_04690 [Lachnospiraceae bacterium]|nr:hypothetical protein [Lachnospiraceae bacterium]